MAVESDTMSRIGKSKSKEQRQKVKDEKEEVVMVKKREVKEKKQGRKLRCKRKDANPNRAHALKEAQPTKPNAFTHLSPMIHSLALFQLQLWPGEDELL
ncbi:hypothetical protein Droror1_Dr00015667 [Drosera rotundifolia]